MQSLLLSIEHFDLYLPTPEGERQVVFDFNATVQTGQCVALVGESGSGKTLTALACVQLLPAGAKVGSNSRIFYQGSDLLDFAERKMQRVRGREIGLVFQDAMSAFNPVKTMGEQIEEVIWLQQRLPKVARRTATYALLEEVGIRDIARVYQSFPHQLSGGMRQRAMIAMALAGEPKLLIADEATTALDVTLQAQIIALLKQLKQTRQMALLFISHDLTVVQDIADEVVVMRAGRLMESGPAQTVFRTPKTDYTKQLIQATPSLQSCHIAIKERGTKNVLSVSDLAVHFPIRRGLLKRLVGQTKAVDGISFNLAEGETVALVGESGSGKTTAAKAILRLITPTAGKVTIGETDLALLSPAALRYQRAAMQFIFQDPVGAMNPRMVIRDVIAEGVDALGKVNSRAEREAIVDCMLEKVGLPIAAKNRYPHEFSGGQRQRICIARALALNPSLLILDEPTSALDVTIQKQILDLLLQLQAEHRLSYLLITHNLGVVAYMAHRVVVMSNGKIVEQGEVAAILQSPQQAYTKSLLASVPGVIQAVE